MYAYIIGTVSEKNVDNVIIENNGIGYNVLMPPSKIAILPDEGFEVKIYTYTSVREDAFELYGFTKKDELMLFKKLITVSGIGPRGALSILSSLTVDQIILAILDGDAKTISIAQGIGKKTAERVIIDLKDKVSATSVSLDGLKDSITDKKSADLDDNMLEAKAALEALGYNAKEATEAVKKASSDGAGNANEILKLALKYL